MPESMPISFAHLLDRHANLHRQSACGAQAFIVIGRRESANRICAFFDQQHLRT